MYRMICLCQTFHGIVLHNYLSLSLFLSFFLSISSSGDPNGKHVVIVDDLVQTGGTLIECAKV